MDGLWRAQAIARRKVDFRGPEKRRVCGSQQASMHEVREKQQPREDAWKMRRTKIVGKMGKASPCRSWFVEKIWIDREKFCCGAENVQAMRGNEWDRRK